jgi:hypothetical protein
MGSYTKNKDDFNFTLLPEKKIFDQDCYVIESAPELIKRKIYDKNVVYIKNRTFPRLS